MSTSARIRALIETAKQAHDRWREERERLASKRTAAQTQDIRDGAAWLSAHVVPPLLELRREMHDHDALVEIEETLAPDGDAPAHEFVGPSVAMRLKHKSASRSTSARYVFHCDGEFLNISREGASGSRLMGMPFEIASNPREAQEIVFEIVRQAIDDYYRHLAD